ncbi:MAG TPA: hypothetical protein VGM05_27990 [Planctomycetaceae bacterium]|jgi:hypothetical protein
MQFRPLVPWGLALFVSVGCQSYYPNGYGQHGPSSAFPSGAYVPMTTMPAGSGGTGAKAFPTPVDGQKSLQSGQNDSSDGNGTRAVPKYKMPLGAPNDLGAPASDDDLDSIKQKGTRNRSDSGSSTGSPAGDTSDELDDSLSSVDGEKFVNPVEYRGASTGSDQSEPRRLAAKSAPSPYKKDPNGYSWLRGVVMRDPKSGSWRLTYGRDNLDDDPYEGNLTLADDEALDVLNDGDVVFVAGQIDRSSLDRFGKPTYRVDQMKGPLKPKGE